MKQLVILSGKGGTGKTSLAAAFAHLAAAGNRPVSAVLADADVDASNLELVLNPTVQETHDFAGGQVAVIDPERCERCGTCAKVCRFDAVLSPASHPGLAAIGDPYSVDPIGCEGCAACVYQCPAQAIHMETELAGQWYRSDTPFGPFFHADMRPAQENSGKLVATIKEHACRLAVDEGRSLVILDGPPGIGCPVISAATGADLALIVTEPTLAGVNGLDRVLQTVEHFGVAAMVCVNRADLHPAGMTEIEKYCSTRDIALTTAIPFDVGVAEAMAEGLPVTLYSPSSSIAGRVSKLWAEVQDALGCAQQDS